MEFGVLGPVAVWHRGVEVAVPKAQQRCVLALLLGEVGRVVVFERFVDVLWDDDRMPSTARNVVQQAVSGLRRVLSVDPGVHLARHGAGYALEVDPALVDLHRFRALVARPGGEERASVLRRALGLWRGEPLQDVSAPGAAPIKQALAEERLAALEERLALEVRAGRDAELVPELRVLVAAHPWHERLQGLLMVALYRAGRPADALRVFHDARRSSVVVTGADPGPGLHRLYERVLRNDPALDRPVGAPSGAPPFGA
ncbi:MULTISPECIES: AfsR/SARP family transcriptional regulator [Actinosynnema]|uniref:AfsR/SARP family transcriptional regulator n=1 Tax=Actinosynnema TaxID=40566 RepID=UPI0020A4E81E|nr:AfsR/SARP family transcriptional regulator [Actinosynnema pretiosum]